MVCQYELGKKTIVSDSNNDLDEFAGMVLEDLSIFLDISLVAGLCSFDQNQQWHCRLEKKIADMVDNSAPQLTPKRERVVLRCFNS